MAKTKSKYVMQDMDDMSIPTYSQCIVRIVQPRGNNLHEVIDGGEEQYLVSMPKKFRKTIWIKRDDYVLIEPIEEGDKVKGEIVKILTKNHIRWYRAHDCWPPAFDEDLENRSEYNNYMTDDDGLFVNTNRRHQERSGNLSLDDSESERESESKRHKSETD